MILGMSLPTFTLVHIAISLIGIAAAFGVLYGFLVSHESGSWTKTFLVFTILTSVTGFFFPFVTVQPPHIVGAISLVVLGVALLALYVFKRAGAWRAIYVVSSVAALYFNVFVLVVQTFIKNPPLKELAPTQSEPAFVIAQGLLLLGFVVLGFLAVKRFQTETHTFGRLRSA